MTFFDLEKILDEYSHNALIQMASFLSVPPPQQKNKAAMIKTLAGSIPDPERIRKLLPQLSQRERSLLDSILRRDGQASLRSLRAELGRLGLIDMNAPVAYGEYGGNTRPNPRAENSRRIEDIVARLMLYGLVFNAKPSSAEQYGYQTKRTFYDAASNLFIPEPILRLLPAPPPLPESKEKLPPITAVQESSARTFQRELYLYWSYIRDHPNTYLTMKDELAKQDLKNINAIMLAREEIKTGKSENDYPRLRFLRSALSAQKLIDDQNHQSLRALESDFFTLAPAERVRQTYQAWLETNRFDELLLLPENYRPRGTANNPLIPARQPVISARKLVVDQARKLKPTDWIPLQALVDRIFDIDYEFLLSRQMVSSGYYYSEVNPYDYLGNVLGLTFPNAGRESEGWNRVEANFIRGVVTGPLFWMGLAELGWASGATSGTPLAFRLTALGAWVLGLGPQPEIATEGGRVIVQPTMQVIALDPIQDAVLATLDIFAERLSAERAVEYRLTRASVYSAQQNGWDAARIKTVLEQYSGSPLPANVARTLDEWQAQFERVIIHPHVALMHGDPRMIDLVTGDRKGADFVSARPLPEVAMLKNPSAILRVSDLLRAHEVLPVLNTRSSIPQNSVTCAVSGEIHFTTRVPSLYLHGHLAAFANPAGEGYQITRDSVQRAVRSGIAAPEIIKRLQSVHAGPLPQKLITSIRAWGSHFGSAALDTLTLLQVRDQAALSDLLADPEVGPLLRRFTPNPPALAVVDPTNLEKLRALLAERGVELDTHLK